MRRHHLRPLTSGLAAAALIGGFLGSPIAQASPSPAGPAPEAPAVDPTTPERSTVALVPSTQSAALPGTTQRILASTPTATREFTMLGVTWQTMPAGARVQVRVRTAAGWQPWQDLQDEATSTEGGRQGTEAVHVGNASAAEARILAPATTTTQPTGARLSLIDSRVLEGDATSRATVQAAATSSAVPAQPSMVTRAGWGADEGLLSYNGSSCVPANVDTTIKAAIVHHTAGTNSYTASQSASIMRGIYAYHVKDRGWCDIGYNFLVDKYGTIFEGRHGGVVNPVHGAHATSWNTDTVGVSVMMNSSLARQSPEAMSAVSRVLAWKLAGNYRTPTGTLTLAGKSINRIARHGDVMSTSCPGTNITAYMPTLRQDVANRMSGWQNSLIYKAYVAAGGEAKMGPVHVMERPWNGGRTTTFTNGGIYQTPENATRRLDKATDARYRTGDSFAQLGWPTTSTTATAYGSVVRFQKGSIHASAKGSYLTVLAIDAWLRANPSQATALGAPTGVMTRGSDGTLYQSFVNGTVRSLNGRTTATLNTSTPAPTPGNNVALMGDQTKDRRADIVATSSTGRLTWFITTTTGVAGSARTGSELKGNYTWLSHVPDVNGDGYSELVARRSDGTLWAWNGRGQGQYVNAHMIGGGGWNALRDLTVVPDMTRDGLPEIVALNAQGSLVRYDLRRDLTVQRPSTLTTGWGAMKQIATVGDLRSAGVVDILAVDANGYLWSYHGTAQGGLSGQRTVISRGWHPYVDLRSSGDHEADGRWDLVARGATGNMYKYRNLGNNSWSSAQVMVTNVENRGVLA